MVPEAVGRMRQRRDNITRRVVRFFGWLVLLTLGAIIWHLVSQSLPLMQTPELRQKGQWSMPEQEQLEVIGGIEHSKYVITRTQDCHLRFYYSDTGLDALVGVKSLPFPCSHQHKVFVHQGQIYLSVLTPAGLLRVERISNLGASFQRQLVFSLAMDQVESTGGNRSSDWQIALGDRWAVVTINSNGNQRAVWIDQAQPANIIEQRLPSADKVIALPRQETLLLRSGNEITVLDRQGNPVQLPIVIAELNDIVPAPSQRSFYTSNMQGDLEKWSLRHNQDGLQFARAWGLSIGYPIASILFDSNGLGALVFSDAGTATLINSVSGDSVLTQNLLAGGVQGVWQGNHLAVASASQAKSYTLSNEAGIVSSDNLWREQHYEGYPDPDFTWQTSSASDFQQQKFSLVPLVIGSIKASFLALLVALPLALGAAIYTAYFASNRVRSYLKPGIEMLEAIPSVVIGFIAAVWLAPMSEAILLSLAILLMLIPAMLILLALFAQPLLQGSFSSTRFTLTVMVIVSVLMLVLGFFAPDMVQLKDKWLSSEAQAPGSTHSTLIVAIALGVAISPSIFTMAEDAIHSVPSSMSKAAFALGATRQQALRKVVLLVALPGIISAVMLGLGRAFGETMIVLMVTGNTPIADWDLLQGLRALTANLTIELPEAEPGTIHFHVLYLTALVLFGFTFIINSVAELLRGYYRQQIGSQ